MVKNSIKVYARLKKEDDRKKVVKYQIYRRADHEDISFPINSTTDATQKNRKYRFCKVFDQVATQADIFTTVAKPIINSVINGFNGTIFAYGQTGSGKTYSITGSPSEYDQRGVLPRSIEQIFELTKTTSNLYNIYVSYLEIYNEIGYDLLNSKCQPSRLEELPRVILLEDANGEAHLRNLSVLPVDNEQEAMRLLFLGDTNRTIAETPMNEYSSRSHCIFTIYLNSRNENGGKMRRSKLHLVDLAGSERICKAKIRGVTLREAKHINLSLHYLEQVILALSQSNRTHIPYRNSMMTYILRDSLSGNSLTIMLATLALTQQNHPETLTTCKFAQRVACISTEAIINEEVDPQQEIQFLRAEVDELRRQLAQAKGENTHKSLTYEEKERCKRIADNFFSNNENIPEHLSSVELRCCLKYLKLRIADNLNNRMDKQMIEEEVKANLITKYNAIIKEKDDEISVLTQLLQMDNHKTNDKQRTNSAPVSTINPYTNLKLQLPMSEQHLFDVFVMDRNNVDGITKIKESIAKKYDLAKNVSKTVQKCQENISEIRQKLAREQMGSEISEKLHTFLISQQRIYKESLGQLEQLKSETDFLKESLRQTENKIMAKFRNAIKSQRMKGDNMDDYVVEQETNSRSRSIKTSHKTVESAKYSNHHTPLIGDQIDIKAFSTGNYRFMVDADKDVSPDQSFTPRIDAGISTDFLLYKNERSTKNFTCSTKSITSRSECATPKSGYEEIANGSSGKGTSRKEMESLLKDDDTPEFVEFMKTIPLTGDLEVDDEIFKFYRSKFKR